MLTRRNILLAAVATVVLLPGCGTRRGKLNDVGARDEHRLVYPVETPDEGVFVAIRGERVLIHDPDEDPPDRVREQAAPTITTARPMVRIQPGEGEPDLPPAGQRLPVYTPPTVAPPRPIPLTRPDANPNR